MVHNYEKVIVPRGCPDRMLLLEVELAVDFSSKDGLCLLLQIGACIIMIPSLHARGVASIYSNNFFSGIDMRSKDSSCCVSGIVVTTRF